MGVWLSGGTGLSCRTQPWCGGKETHQKKQNKTKRNILHAIATYGCPRHPGVGLDLHTLAGLSVILIVYAIYLWV